MPYHKTNRTLRDLRANSPELDRDDTALALPPTPPYRHGGERNRPTTNVANTPAELHAWCDAQGLDPATAVGRAMWNAVRMWARSKGLRSARAALITISANYVQKVAGRPDAVVTNDAFQKANAVLVQWELAGRPLFGLACADAQRSLIGLQNVKARRNALEKLN